MSSKVPNLMIASTRWTICDRGRFYFLTLLLKCQSPRNVTMSFKSDRCREIIVFPNYLHITLQTFFFQSNVCWWDFIFRRWKTGISLSVDKSGHNTCHWGCPTPEQGVGVWLRQPSREKYTCVRFEANGATSTSVNEYLSTRGGTLVSANGPPGVNPTNPCLAIRRITYSQANANPL